MRFEPEEERVAGFGFIVVGGCGGEGEGVGGRGGGEGGDALREGDELEEEEVERCGGGVGGGRVGVRVGRWERREGHCEWRSWSGGAAVVVGLRARWWELDWR